MTAPCCCSLQEGTRAIAIFQIVGSVIVMILFAILAALVFLLVSPELDFWGASILGIIILVFIFLAGGIGLVFGIILLKGANQRDAQKCQTWFTGQIIMMCVAILSSFGPKRGILGVSVPAFLLWCYFMWVVSAFISEIKTKTRSGSKGNSK